MLQFLLSLSLGLGLGLGLDNEKNYETLNIAIVSGYSRMPRNVQVDLQNSLKWFKNAILVTKFEKSITPLEILQLYPKFSFLNIQTADQNLENLHVKNQDFPKVLKSSNFVILVHRDSEKCQKDFELLASAKPMTPEGLNRPRFGTMNICGNFGFPNFFDLFRHEILHALGFGLFVPFDDPLPIRTIDWYSPRGVQKMNQTFLDFSKKAKKAVAIHFNCPNFGGVEGDGVRKNHLNEYIFGNELMTPNLENSKNYFSDISAAILEETYFGEVQWYKVNRSFTKLESQSYWYGRNFGCEFLSSSCWTFLKAKELENVPTFPFCSRNNEKFCIQTATSKMRQNCHQHQNPTYRHCPIDPNFFNLPPNHRIVPC